MLRSPLVRGRTAACGYRVLSARGWTRSELLADGQADRGGLGGWLPKAIWRALLPTRRSPRLTHPPVGVSSHPSAQWASASEVRRRDGSDQDLRLLARVSVMRVCGVVLSAGRGTRLAPFSDVRPKASFPLGSRILLDRAVSDVRRCRRTSLAAPALRQASYSLQVTVGPAGHVPSGPAGVGSGLLPGTFLPTTPFTDSVE